MSISITCSCGKTLRARDEHAGKQTRCPACGAAVTIPSTPVSALEESPPIPPGETIKSRASRATVLSLCAVGIVTAAAGAGGTMWWLNREDNAKQHRADSRNGEQPQPEDAVKDSVQETAANASFANDPDLDLVPRDALAFVSIRVADWWDTPFGKQFQAAVRKMDPAEFIWMEKELGLTPADIERTTVVMSLKPANAGPPFEVSRMIVRLNKAYEKTRFIKALGLSEERRADRAAYFVNPQTHDSYCFMSDRLFVSGPETAMRASLTSQPRRQGPLEGALKLAQSKHAFTAGFNPPWALLQPLRTNVPPSLKPLEVFLDVKNAMLFIDATNELQYDLEVQFPDEATAKKGEAAARFALTLARQAWTPQKTELAKQLMGLPIESTVKVVDDFLESDPFHQNGTQLHAKLTMSREVAATLPALLLPAVQKVREAANRLKASNNFKQIALGMLNYESVHGTFPPAVIMSKDGKPLYSWRVAILNYIDDAEARAVYKEFRKDEPWDSPHNKKLLAGMPKVYELPGHDAPQAGGSFIQVFTGAQAAFDGSNKPRTFASFRDGLSNTLLLAEAAEAVPWTKPVDLVYAADKPVPKLGNHYGQGTLISTADGAVRFLNPKISEKTLRAAITPAGGETLGPDW